MILKKIDNCDEMLAALDDPTVAITYHPRFREYSVFCPTSHETLEKQGYGLNSALRHRVFSSTKYCPWSGRMLPHSLRGIWFTLLLTKMGVDSISDLLPADPRVEEYLTEAWWQRRNLGARVGEDPFPKEPEPEGGVPYDGQWEDVLPGFWRSENPPAHYCPETYWIFRDGRTMYAYVPHVREFGVRILDLSKPVDYQPIRIKAVRYCPWCGTELPPSLRSEWEKRLAAMGLAPDSENIPARLLSDTWWKDAGL